jgi:hypothetical protein
MAHVYLPITNFERAYCHETRCENFTTRNMPNFSYLTISNNKADARNCDMEAAPVLISYDIQKIGLKISKKKRRDFFRQYFIEKQTTIWCSELCHSRCVL